jgi:hypothetical protein
MPHVTVAEPDADLTARGWWAGQRLRYNVGLLIAGALDLFSTSSPWTRALTFVATAIRSRFSRQFFKLAGMS